MIYDWLNPSKTSNANYRIECTVVRDLLDTEIEYVSALRRVVQVVPFIIYEVGIFLFFSIFSSFYSIVFYLFKGLSTGIG